MIWKKDKLRPTQPYFVFDTKNFYQEVYLRQGISHFYNYEVMENIPLRIVPDGCMDLIFTYNQENMQGYVCGTPLKYTCEKRENMKEIFGIRFMPGIQPALIQCTMKDLLGKMIPIESVLIGDSSWLSTLEKEHDFYQRIRIFIEAYTKVVNQRKKAMEKQEIVQSIKQMVYASDGKIKIYEMEEKTGYSVRYINKAFIDEMGFSPKTFCKIIQFQRALEFLNYGAPDKMTDAAVYLGYYDQSQFIHDFSKYAGITPKKYLKLVVETKYKEKIIEREMTKASNKEV